jgi:hypothetical protein
LELKGGNKPIKKTKQNNNNNNNNNLNLIDVGCPTQRESTTTITHSI